MSNDQFHDPQPSTYQSTTTPSAPQPPHQGYQGQGYQPGPAAPLNPELERQLVCAAHWSPIASVLLGGLTFFGPLIVLLIGGGRSRAVRDHAIDALNFQITVWLATLAVVLISIPLMILLVGFVTIWLAALIPIAALVVHGVAAVKVATGESYRYPMTLQLIK